MIGSNFLIETLIDFYSLIIYASTNEQADEYGNQIYNIFSKIEILKKNSFLINKKEFNQKMMKEFNFFNSIFSKEFSKTILNDESKNEIFEIKQKIIQNSIETTKLILKSKKKEKEIKKLYLVDKIIFQK